MTTDNQKKYVEAARKYYQDRYPNGSKKDFLAGASFAEKENEAFIQALKKMLEEKDDQMALQHEIHKNAEKEAHNAAIEKVIKKIEGYDIPMKYIRMDLEKLKI